MKFAVIQAIVSWPFERAESSIPLAKSDRSVPPIEHMKLV